MKILNRTKGTLIAQDAVLKATFWARMKGLLGERGLAAGCAVILLPCNSIHTFFMRFSIDVLFVDKNNRVAKTIADLAPFRLSSICFKATSAVELPAGTIKASRTSFGDILEIS